MIICWSSLCFGQLSGRFYLDREAYAPGEPVFLYFELTKQWRRCLQHLLGKSSHFCTYNNPRHPPRDRACGRFQMGLIGCVLRQQKWV